MNNKNLEYENSEFYQKIEGAEMILVGIGEEFDQRKMLREVPGYIEGRDFLENSDIAWMIPAWNQMFIEGNQGLRDGLEKLAGLLSDKNYFVVSTSTNDVIREIPWREGRLVMVCGGSSLKQCSTGCEQGLMDVSNDDWKCMEAYKKEICAGRLNHMTGMNLGICPICGSPLILNNVYTEKYDENGYLEQWGIYTKWLQGTLNRKLLILELGVGMQYPSVIRFPFEKIGFYNQKAFFYRINEKIYQLTEELNGKGIAIAKNAIDWLEYL